MLSRRAFMAAAGAGFAASHAPLHAQALAEAEQVFATTGRLSDGSFAALLVNERGGRIATLPLSERGHDVTQCAITGRLAIFARRPGTFALILDGKGNSLETLSSIEGRHFYGHGAFSPDGNLLYATENAFEIAQGRIGIYDATDQFRRIGEFDSFGLDPHDMYLSADGRMIVVANGGIETHPDFGRAMLNLASMQPNLAFIDARDGTLIARHDLPAHLHKLSFHHLAPGAGRTAWVGGQYWGDTAQLVPLIASASPDSPLKFVEMPDAIAARLNFYIGSVASSPDGSEIVATAPKGNVAVHLDVANNRTAMIEAHDICAADWAGSSFAFGAGGHLLMPGGKDIGTDFAFDNHLMTLKS